MGSSTHLWDPLVGRGLAGFWQARVPHQSQVQAQFDVDPLQQIHESIMIIVRIPILIYIHNIKHHATPLAGTAPIAKDTDKAQAFINQQLASAGPWIIFYNFRLNQIPLAPIKH